MKGWLSVAGVIIVLLLGLSAWRFWPQQRVVTEDTAKPTPTPAQSCGVMALDSVPADVVILIDSDWQPQDMKVGQTVRWENKMDTTVTLESKPQQHGQSCGGFGSVVLQPDQAYQLTFLRAGDWFFGLAPKQVGAIIAVSE